MMNVIKLPKRLAGWLYSISLVLIVCLTIGFIAVTPIDIMAKTSSGTPDPAVKVVIVTVVCVLFLVWSFIIYFARVVRLRIRMNDIPSKSIYIPSRHDFVPQVWHHIDDELKRCLTQVRVEAGPLYAHEPINCNGLAPPQYIQKNNEKNGHVNLLPPLTRYDEIIQSLGDKFMNSNRFKGRQGTSANMTKMAMTMVDIPVNYSFKEIVLYLEKMYSGQEDCWDGSDRLVELYEKFRFSGELISEEDIMEFMIEFDKLGKLVQKDRD